MTAFLDTNVFIYAVNTHPSEQTKRHRARALINRGDLALSLQVLNEFMWQSTRPNRGPRLSIEDAIGYMTAWRRFPVQETTLALLDEGLAILHRHKLAFWDCMIVAAARAQGCEVLYTEDMQDGRIVDGLRIVNPFKPID